MHTWREGYQGVLDAGTIAGERAAPNAIIGDVPDDIPDLAHPSFIGDCADCEAAITELSTDANNAVSQLLPAGGRNPTHLLFPDQGTALEQLTDTIYLSFIVCMDYSGGIHFELKHIIVRVSSPRIACQSDVMRAVIEKMEEIFRQDIVAPAVISRNEPRENIIPPHQMQQHLAHLSSSPPATPSHRADRSSTTTPSSVSTFTPSSASTSTTTSPAPAIASNINDATPSHHSQMATCSSPPVSCTPELPSTAPPDISEQAAHEEHPSLSNVGARTAGDEAAFWADAMPLMQDVHHIDTLEAAFLKCKWMRNQEVSTAPVFSGAMPASAPPMPARNQHCTIQPTTPRCWTPVLSPIMVTQNIYMTGLAVPNRDAEWLSDLLHYSVPDDIKVSSELCVLLESLGVPNIAWLEVSACVCQGPGHAIKHWHSILDICGIPETYKDELLEVMHHDAKQY